MNVTLISIGFGLAMKMLTWSIHLAKSPEDHERWAAGHKISTRRKTRASTNFHHCKRIWLPNMIQFPIKRLHSVNSFKGLSNSDKEHNEDDRRFLAVKEGFFTLGVTGKRSRGWMGNTEIKIHYLNKPGYYWRWDDWCWASTGEVTIAPGIYLLTLNCIAVELYWRRR